MGKARRPPRSSQTPTRTNRAQWEKSSDEYERRHRRALRVAGGESWGLYRIPESTLRLLDNVDGSDVLEVGCGAAIWSIALADRGARAVALDFSRAHLRHARQNTIRGGDRIGLLEADAERLPLRDGRFDLAFCDWGALFFADPDRTIPEVARVLRPGGQLVFATGHPLRAVAQSRRSGRMGRRLAYDYFGLGRIALDGGFEHYRTIGDWIDLFRRNGLAVERLVEPRAPRRRRSSYLTTRDHAWGQRWPLEAIWVLRRQAMADPGGSRTTAPRRPKRPSGSR
jgi:SAM-dependent methyltransferase